MSVVAWPALGKPEGRLGGREMLPNRVLAVAAHLSKDTNNQRMFQGRRGLRFVGRSSVKLEQSKLPRNRPPTRLPGPGSFCKEAWSRR